MAYQLASYQLSYKFKCLVVASSQPNTGAYGLYIKEWVMSGLNNNDANFPTLAEMNLKIASSFIYIQKDD